MAEMLCYGISRWMVRRRQLGQAGANPSTFSEEGYTEWRDEALPRNFLRYFKIEDIQEKAVLDFGCGEGSLSFFLMPEAKTIIGIDANPQLIAKANKHLQTRRTGNAPPIFQIANQLNSIDLPDGSVDVILCFDAVEHIMEYGAIMREWHRILRGGGRVLIWWVPWWNPYGPHIESLVPIPWAHVLFSDQTLLRTCARMYDSGDFKARVWDLDESGRKKPNKWLNMTSLPEVNRLTIAGFEKTAEQSGFQIKRREIHGFGGGTFSRLTRPLVRIPWVREFFCNFTVYELAKPD